ncbi:hypothetical protein [Pseudooceanicola aestuarii]|uniref:hypothetical protein n=1 Tax=Pseudooceanicola aestuarii TaxID=2697319 RepID=UPI0013D2FEFC|nr:hypothetical protein [Pseudooceanicola aestuarii]
MRPFALSLAALLIANPVLASVGSEAEPEALRPDTLSLAQPMIVHNDEIAAEIADCRATLAQALGAPFPGQTATDLRDPSALAPATACVLADGRG